MKSRSSGIARDSSRRNSKMSALSRSSCSAYFPAVRVQQSKQSWVSHQVAAANSKEYSFHSACHAKSDRNLAGGCRCSRYRKVNLGLTALFSKEPMP